MLYHYTSPEAIMGIIRDEGICLRFSRYDCLNDINEGRQVVSVQQAVCNELRAEFAGDARRLGSLQRISELKPDFKSNSVTNPDISAVPYICSLSREQDALTMWNYYTKGSHYEGYNIGLELDGKKPYVAEVFENGEVYGYGRSSSGREKDVDRDRQKHGCNRLSFEVRDVIYDRKRQYDAVMEEIRKCIERDENAQHAEDFGHTETGQHFKGIKNSQYAERTGNGFRDTEYMTHLNEWAIGFKDEIFRHEKESRLVCYVPEGGSMHGSIDTTLSMDDHIRFRRVNGCLIPYIDILIWDKALLRRLTIGPLIEKKLARETMKLFLRLRGYGDVIIDTSDAPIRY